MLRRHALPLLLPLALLVGCGGGFGIEKIDGGAPPDAADDPDGAASPDGATGPDGSGPECTPPASQPCTCPGGASGTQPCTPGGTWGLCECATCTPVGHDEDGDGTDDACDTCPTLPDPGQDDADGDGLGDACEWPGDPGLLDHVDHLETWRDGPPAPAGWDLDPGFSVETDRVAGTNADGGANAIWDLALTRPYGVEMGFSFAGPGGGGWVGLLFGHADVGTGVPAFYGCFLRRQEMGPTVQTSLELWHYPGSGQNVLMDEQVTNAEPANTPANSLRRLRVFVQGDAVRCLFSNADGVRQETSHTYTAPPGGIEGAVGYRIYAQTAEFTYLVTYR